MTTQTVHYHTAFGLAIRSCLPLPELLPAAPGETVDVEIVRGEVPAELPGVLKRGVRYQATAETLRLQVDGVATYLVAHGRCITIAPEADAEEADVRVFLLASVFGALLHQRHDLVLHGSAIDWAGEAVVFLGSSGVGKSTLAAAFRQWGHALLTDDLCVVRPAADGRMMAQPGFPQTKLWLDSLAQLEIPIDGLPRVRRKLEKRALPLPDQFVREPRPVKKLYLLYPKHNDELKLTPVQGPQKFLLLKNQTYRFGFLAAIESKAGHFAHALRLAQQAPLAWAERPSEAFRLQELVEAIEADLRV